MSRLLASKLAPSPASAGLVARPRLLQALDSGLERPLTLVHAPAGSGKTCLAQQWCQGHSGRATWLGLEPADNKVGRFLAYALAAIGRCHPRVAGEAEGMLAADVGALDELLADLVVIPLSEADESIIWVIDDVHHLTDERIHSGLVWLIEHLPPQLRLVVTARSVPPWPLARWRARGLVFDIDHNALSFTRDEAAELVRLRWPEKLDETRLGELYERTRGWATGLVLAVHHGRSVGCRAGLGDDYDAPSFEYIVQEVLDDLEPGLRRFVLETSLLDDFDHNLADAVCSEQAWPAERAIRALVQRQLFIEALGNEPPRFRYQPLMQACLRQQVEPGQRAALHRRASHWYAGRGQAIACIAHAKHSNDLKFLAEQIEAFGGPVSMTGDMETLNQWLDWLPPPAIETSAILGILRAWTHLYRGRHQLMVAALEAIDRALQSSTPTQGTAQLASLQRSLQAAFALRDGRAEEALRLLDQLLAARPELDGGRAIMELSAGEAHLLLGRPHDALPHFVRAETDGLSQENPNITVTARARRSEALAACGDHPTARTTAEAGLRYALDRGCGHLSPAGLVRLQLAALDLAAGRLDAATESVEQAMPCLGCHSDQWHRAKAYDIMVGIALARGQRVSAERLVDAARGELGDSGFVGVRSTLTGLEARLHETSPVVASTELASGKEDPGAVPAPLLDPLTQRETEVLALLATGLSNREIARELGVSTATIKTHLHHGYRKLGVSSRTAAVRAAQAHIRRHPRAR